jgi:hypothetical protein
MVAMAQLTINPGHDLVLVRADNLLECNRNEWKIISTIRGTLGAAERSMYSVYGGCIVELLARLY